MIETPEDVLRALGMDPEAGAAPADEGDVDAIVRAAKAMRDGKAPMQAVQSVAKICLIVDDSRVIRKVSSKIAKSMGYIPVEAQDGTEALARCKQAMRLTCKLTTRDGATFAATTAQLTFCTKSCAAS